MLCLVLMADTARAIEVENLAEAFLTGTSRADALARGGARREAVGAVWRREGVEVAAGVVAAGVDALEGGEVRRSGDGEV